MRDPTFPLDLERMIFELAALTRPRSVLNLLLVAWRVNIWVEPHLYRTLVIGPSPVFGLPRCSVEIFNRIVRTKSPSFLRNSVRNLMIWGVTANQAKTIISACGGIQNLKILAASDQLPLSTLSAFDTMPLRHLYGDLACLFDAFSVPFHHPMFTQITHLELTDTLDGEDGSTHWTGLSYLPNLTHLALSREVESLQVFADILAAYKSLAALLHLPHFPPATHTISDNLANDPRFVIMELPHRTTDWQNGILSGNDYWARAEHFIAMRRAGKMDRERHVSYFA
ncbi:hypothetical protein DFH07DRAFT_990544 [Mycena maculata]|uniref:Uncharacterized protein n=1 Tax=Mycena maculata TaxID=230809 RepID=A0AAD7MUB2_9AGAR|nr:hypothetical protein DFH07DRAFT_990544 [Mycena maculata]